MARLIIERGNATYYVNEKGEITYTGWDTPSARWTCVGVAGSWNAHGPTWTWEMISSDVEGFRAWLRSLRGRMPWVFDRDHGTLRMWASPRIRRFIVES